MQTTDTTPDADARIAELEARLIAVGDGYRHDLYELRERIAGLLGRDVSRWLTTALDAVRADRPAIAAADEHIERALEAIAAFVTTERNQAQPVADADNGAATLWHYAMECGAGPEPDMLAQTATYLRQVGSPTALRFVERLERGDSPALVELQLTRWMNAGITSHCLDRNVTLLSEQHELSAAMTEAEARAALDAMPASDRLAHWNQD